MLEIRLLGELEVVRDGAVIELPPSAQTRALLAYLAATARAHSRAHLCDLLWDGAPSGRAQLRRGLATIRGLLGEDATRLTTDRTTVAFDAAGVGLDLRATRQAAAAGLERLGTTALRELAARFRGEFLEGLDLPRHHEYHAWCLAERAGARRGHAAVLSALVDRLDDHPDDALRHARAWLALEPHTEAACAAVVRLLGRLGRTREAREQYDHCRRLFERELGERPTVLLEAARLGVHA